MRFPRTWRALAVALFGLAAALPVVARGKAIEAGYYALYEITIGDFENGEPVILNEYPANKRGDGTYDVVRVSRDSAGTPFAQRLVVDRSGRIVAKDSLLICDGTEETRIRPYSTTVFTYSLRATDTDLTVIVAAEEKKAGSAATHRKPSVFVVNHYRKVSTGR